MNSHPPRFGVWAPYRGKWIIDPARDVQRASYDFTEQVVLSAEKAGFDTVLIAQHTINPTNQEFEILEAWTSAAAVAALTSRIEIIAAIKPRLYHPVVLAKMALGIEDISKGRFAINFVNAWFKPELERSGIGFPEHDERYAYGTEWLGLVKQLLAGETVTHEGEHFNIREYTLRPASRFRERPYIYAGGESGPARELAAGLADAWFINGQPLEEVQALIADVSSRPRHGKPIQFALSGHVIARESDGEAQSVLDYQTKFAPDPAKRAEFLKNVDPKAVMFQTGKKFPGLVGANGGIAPGFVGSYDRVAQRLAEFHQAGITTFMLSFDPLVEEQERFASHVIPRVRELVRHRQGRSGVGALDAVLAS